MLTINLLTFHLTKKSQTNKFPHLLIRSGLQSSCNANYDGYDDEHIYLGIRETSGDRGVPPNTSTS